MEFLLAQGLDINAKSSNGWTPLMCTLTPIERNPSKSPADVLHAARFLLTQGADANVTTEEGWTPLHGAALYCDPDASGQVADLTRELIARGVDPQARARSLSPAAEVVVPSSGLPWDYRLKRAMADLSNKRDTFGIVIRRALTPLYWATEHGALGVIKALLAHGVDVESLDVDGIPVSPARMAAKSKFLKSQPGLVDSIVELLLAAGAGF